MATLRLFAGLKDAAGRARVEIDGSTVGEVLDRANETFGSDFARGAAGARVWLNGEETEREATVADADEVALLPPVSGGSAAYAQAPGFPPGVVFPLAALLAVVGANIVGGHAVWSAAIVAMVAIWVADLGNVMRQRGIILPTPPIFFSILGTMIAVNVFGRPGLGIAVIVSVVAPFAWSLAATGSRDIPIVSSSILVAVMASAATASLILFRPAWSEAATGVFLAIAIVGSVVVFAVRRFPSVPLSDPFSATVVGSVVIALILAAVWNLSLVTYLIVGVTSAAALIGGRTLGSVLRTRTVELVDDPPGMLVGLDGVILAGALLLPVVDLVT